MKYVFTLLLALLPATALAQNRGTPTFTRLSTGGIAVGNGILSYDPATSFTWNGDPSHTPANAIVMGPANSVYACPSFSCVTANGSTNHQRASLVVSAETQTDGAAEEQTMLIMGRINKGYVRPWASNTYYNLGDNVATGNAVYRAIQAGTSAGGGGGPSGTGTVGDNGVVWQWINDYAIAAKVGNIYAETRVEAGAGGSWGSAFNMQLMPGYNPTFAANLEMDFSNKSGQDCVPGPANCYNLWLNTGGSNRSTNALYISSPNQVGESFSTYWAQRFAGDRLASNAIMAVDTRNSDYGIGTGIVTGAQFNQAAFFDNSSTPRGLWLNGSYSGYAIISPGFSVNPAGFVSSSGIHINPGSPGSGDPCNPGDIRVGDTRIFVCTSPNHWMAANLSNY